MISATLDLYRALRDAASEAMFFQTFGTMFALTAGDEPAEQIRDAADRKASADDSVRHALAAARHGGYAAAAARIGALLARHGEPLPLDRLELRERMKHDYADLLPAIDPAEWRRLRGEQELLCSESPDEAE